MPPLPPEDQAPYFDVKETTLTNAANGTQIAKADSQRVVLIVSTVAAAGVVSVSLEAAGGANRGIAISNVSPLLLTQGDVGTLVGQAWFAVGNPITSVTVTEVFLRRRPGKYLEGLAP